MSRQEKAKGKAKQALMAKIDGGSVPADLTEQLNARFESVAPPGASSSDEVATLIESLLTWQFVPDVPKSSTRRRGARMAKLAKLLLAPLTTWQLRHLTDQMNAYSAVQAEVLRAILEKVNREAP